MKSRYIIVFLFPLLVSCVYNDRSKHSFKLIDYTFDDGWKERYSIRIESKKVYLGVGRNRIDYFVGSISPEQEAFLDRLTEAVISTSDKTTYIKSELVDQPSYKMILITKMADTFSVYAYGTRGQKELDSFSHYLQFLKEHIAFKKVDTEWPFESRHTFGESAIKDTFRIVPPSR